MRLLLDQNLSPWLIDLLADLYPGSQHVRSVGLGAANDEQVWSYAARDGLAIVSKDTDFLQRSFLFGGRPKVIWIRLGNCSTDDLARLLRPHHADLLAFDQRDEQPVHARAPDPAGRVELELPAV